ncbi:SAM-dependent methyltransferase [Fodinicola feengrottensis]|nr:SAM-dependent methyltransferase [Fodinicola feengrottensis]
MPNPAARTAVGPMTIVAAAQWGPQEHRIHEDKLAYGFLPAATRAIVSLTRWEPARRALFNATESRAKGLWAEMLCRKRYVDDKLRAAVTAGVDNVVILGAGLDTLAYRRPVPAGTAVFEVDQPDTISYKKKAVTRALGKMPATVTLVPIDFQKENLREVLTAHGYRSGGRTFFVWEAVTQYLTEDAVRSCFTFLSQASAGSELVFTYVRKDFLDGITLYGAEGAYLDFVMKNRLWQFGMNPDQVEGFLADYSWMVKEQLGGKEFTARYVAPSGSRLPVTDIEQSCYAVKS